jgi:hypothetical protein
MSKRKTKHIAGKSNRHSTIDQHRRQGSLLVPPLVALPKLQSSSWRDERLPEMLWATLLVAGLPRPKALNVFRHVAHYVFQLREREDCPSDVTQSGMANVKPDLLIGLLESMLVEDACGEILSSLLLLKDLPAREYWSRVLQREPTSDGWNRLMRAAALTLDHQSQEATDCRWVRLICVINAGKLLLPPELAKEILLYPDHGDMHQVRPSIRAMEIVIELPDPKHGWANKFWLQCMVDTPCFPLQSTTNLAAIRKGTTPERLKEIYDLLVDHCNQTRIATSVDPRHDTVFGIGLYCLSILHELLRIGASQSISGRIALRTLVECYITLAYLAKRDDPDLWKSHRVFGAGQAKLAYLKLEDMSEGTAFVGADTLKNLANEDVWEEFLPIELGHWEKMNLRSESIEAGDKVKEDYDKFYPWASQFTHGHWGAIRDSVFDTCGNPLHRLHRIPRSSARGLPDVIPDACTLVDKVLEIVSRSYPDFNYRVTIS